MCPSSSTDRQLAMSPDREDEDDRIGTSESLALLQMDIGTDSSEQNVAQGSSGNREDDERDMNAATSNPILVFNNGTFNDIQGNYYSVCLFATTSAFARMSRSAVDLDIGHNHVAQYFGEELSRGGAYCVAATVFTWVANNATPYTQRATAIAVGFIMRNLGGILGGILMTDMSFWPTHLDRDNLNVVISALIVVFSFVNLVYLWHQNKRNRGIRLTPLREQEQPALGDKPEYVL